ncbi:hypothetical protein TNCV_2752881 [Trichonephila clavipes]|nr:hypothetical protein TNCV_2752881 [Trichonephila clavipes]
MLEILQSVQHVEAIHTNEFAVHIQGGEDKAKELAKKYGFVNRGQSNGPGRATYEGPMGRRHIYGAPPGTKMVRTGNYGRSEGGWCGQSYVSTFGSRRPPINCGNHTSHFYHRFSACAGHLSCSHIDQNHYSLIG